MYAPVVIFVYNRPIHTKKMLESLNENYLSNETDVFIFADGPKIGTMMSDEIVETRKIINSLLSNNKFKSLSITESVSNKGLANSVIGGISQLFEKYETVIVLEDDLMLSRDFLKYMNEALSYYQENAKVWSVSGNTPTLRINNGNNVFFAPRINSWGWGTWRDRWNKVDWNCSEYNMFSFMQRKRFNKGGKDLSMMMDHQILKLIDSWAIRWSFNSFINDAYTVYPIISKVKNIGMDESGSHNLIKVNEYKKIYLQGQIKEKCIEFIDFYIDKNMEDEFAKRYKPSIVMKICHYFLLILTYFFGVENIRKLNIRKFYISFKKIISRKFI